MPTNSIDPQQEDAPPLRPSNRPFLKMQWAFFKVITILTCLIVLGSFAAFVVTGNPWCLTLDICGFPLGAIWVIMAKYLFPLYNK